MPKASQYPAIKTFSRQLNVLGGREDGALAVIMMRSKKTRCGGCSGSASLPGRSGGDGVLIDVEPRLIRAEVDVHVGGKMANEITAVHGVLEGIRIQQIGANQSNPG